MVFHKGELLLTINETCDFFGERRDVIRALMKAYRVVTLPVPHAPAAKGVPLSAIRTIARALNRPEPTEQDIHDFLSVAA